MSDHQPYEKPADAPPRRPTARQRLRYVLVPRATRSQAVVALACLVLGFGLSVQARSTGSASTFASLRQSELVSVLDRLTQRQDDLRRELLELQQQRAALRRDDSGAARQAAEQRAQTLAILAGTAPASGPGIELLVTDPERAVKAADILGAVQELRDSGAEVLQIGPVRVAAGTYFLDGDGGVVVDGRQLHPPYRILAIGDPHTMATALGIPGGVLDSLHRLDADGAVTETPSVSITAVRRP